PRDEEPREARAYRSSADAATLARCERLDPDDRCAVRVADPEGHRRRGIVHEDATDVRRAGQGVFDETARPRVKAQDAVVRFPSRPDFTVLVDRRVVRPRSGSGRGPFFEALGASVEHSDPVAAVFAEPETVLSVHHAAARTRIVGRSLEDSDLAGL